MNVGIFINYSRPVGELKVLRAKIRAELETFMRSPQRNRTKVRITPNFEMEIAPSFRNHGSFFVLGISADRDAGGFVLAEIEKNLRLCIAEKELKIAPYRTSTLSGGWSLKITSISPWIQKTKTTFGR